MMSLISFLLQENHDENTVIVQQNERSISQFPPAKVSDNEIDALRRDLRARLEHEPIDGIRIRFTDHTGHSFVRRFRPTDSCQVSLDLSFIIYKLAVAKLSIQQVMICKFTIVQGPDYMEASWPGCRAGSAAETVLT